MIQQNQTSPFGAAHYQLAMEAAGIGLWDWDLVLNRMVWSDQCKSIFDLPADAVVSYELFLSCLHPDDRERVDRTLQKSLAEKVGYILEYRILWPDRSIHWLAARGQGIYGQDECAVRMIGVVADITPQKLAEEHQRLVEKYTRETLEEANRQSEELARQLATKQAFLQTLIEQAPSGLLIVDAPSDKLIFYNEEAFRLLGHALLEGEDYRKYIHYGAIHADGSFYRQEEYPLTRALNSGEVVKQEFMRYLRKDGTPVYLAVNAAPIHDSKGQIIAAVCAFDDISESYELERRKDEFISMASHELRTPLTGMMGNLQMAERRLKRLLSDEEDASEEERRGLVEDIGIRVARALSQVKMQSRMIDDLLDATRIQAKKLRLSLEPCNLVQIVQEVVSDLLVMHSQRTVALNLPDRTKIMVLADAVRIGQVVHNFLTNALKYSPETEPVVVGIHLEASQARVWVRDAGPGLSQEVQQHIWERFYQHPGDGWREGVGGGDLGLGLYISQVLIQEHGGSIGVESALGEGSTFWFILPLASA
jgi:PAS domain S-box-containing protein